MSTLIALSILSVVFLLVEEVRNVMKRRRTSTSHTKEEHKEVICLSCKKKMLSKDKINEKKDLKTISQMTAYF